MKDKTVVSSLLWDVVGNRGGVGRSNTKEVADCI